MGQLASGGAHGGEGEPNPRPRTPYGYPCSCRTHAAASRKGRGGRGEGLKASDHLLFEAGRIEAAALELGLELGHLHRLEVN